MLKIILNKDKGENIKNLNFLYLKLINDNKVEIPLIKVISCDGFSEVTFRLPLELQAFITGLEFSDHMSYIDNKE